MNPTPGWYPDPAGQPDTVRYWDGQAWSDQTQPVAPGPADPDLTHKVDPAARHGGGDQWQPGQGGPGTPASPHQSAGQPSAQPQASAQSQASATPPAPGADGGRSGPQYSQGPSFSRGQGFGTQGPGDQGAGAQGQQGGWQQGQAFGQQGQTQQGPGGWHQQPSLHPDAGGSGDKPGGGWWGRQSQGGRIALIVGAVMVLAAIIAGIVFLPKILGGEPEPTEPTDPVATQPLDPSGQPTEEPTDQPTNGNPQGGEPDCMAGNGASVDAAQPNYTSTGVTVDSPPDWGFRFSKDQWTWVDDQAAWGRSTGGDVVGGLVLGGVRKDAGFSDPQIAASGVLGCLESNGVFAGEDFTPTPGADEQTTVGGMSGWKKEITYKVGDRADRITVYILDSGNPDAYAQLITIAEDGNPEASQAIDAAVASVRKG